MAKVWGVKVVDGCGNLRRLDLVRGSMALSCSGVSSPLPGCHEMIDCDLHVLLPCYSLSLQTHSNGANHEARPLEPQAQTNPLI